MPALERLCQAFGVLLVIAQPDRPAGRGLRLSSPPTVAAARRLGLPILQPNTINAPPALDQLRALNLDVLVVAAFGQFLAPPVLSLPRLGCVNLHASLLPRYRGAAPVAWAIIRGERETGVTTFLLDEGMDTGPILLQRAVPIGEEETAGELEGRLAALGAELLVETLHGLAAGTIHPRPQPAEGTLAPKLHKEDGRIRWTWDARQIHNLVRGTNPWPGAQTTLRERLVKVHHTRVVAGEGSAGAPGEILPRRDRLVAAAGSGALEVLELQPAGCRILSGREFINGYCRCGGERFV